MTIPPDATSVPPRVDPGTGVTTPLQAVRDAPAPPGRSQPTFASSSSVSAAVTIPPESEMPSLPGDDDGHPTPTPEVATVAWGRQLPESAPARPGAAGTRAKVAATPPPSATPSSAPGSGGQILAPTGMAEPRSRFGFWIAFAVVLLCGLIYLLVR
jgi:hypothetical protein